MEKRVVVVGATHFPGSHCLHIQLPDALKLRRSVFVKEAQISDEDFDRWRLQSPRPFSISIPPMPVGEGRALQEQPALLTFSAKKGDANADAYAAEVCTAECAIVLFRREEEPGEHAMAKDMVPLLRRIRALCAEPPDLDDIIRRMLMHVSEFYCTVDASRMAPVLKQRVYAPTTDEYLGHVCAACGAVATRRCPCRIGVYYCNRECQRGHWPAHKPLCVSRRQAPKQ